MQLLVFDIGGTYIKYALMDEKHRFLLKDKQKTPLDGKAQLIETLGSIYDQVSPVDGIAISMPGIVDVQRGHCFVGGPLSFLNDYDFRDAIEKRCQVKVFLDNDGKCAAMAEATCGSLSDVKDGFVILIGTMIGGAFIKNHEIHRGKHFSAGEVSYIGTDRNAFPSPDNIWGNCCGIPRLCRMYAEKTNSDESMIDGFLVCDALENGDKRAMECMDIFTREIALQIFNLQNILDPERFAIGGGISEREIFLTYIQNNLQKIYEQFPYPVPQAEIVNCYFRNDANLIGAVQGFLAFYRQFSQHY